LTSQNAEAASQAESLVTLLGKFADAELVLSDAEVRAAEDFRDIIARYDVLFRANEEYLQAKNAYDASAAATKRAAAADLAESTKPSYEKSKYTLQANLQKAKDAQRKALETYKEKATQLIDVRNRYTKFKVRCLRHGWNLYGTALKQAAQTEGVLLQEIKGIFAGLRVAGAPKEVVSQAEQAVQQQIDVAPAADDDQYQQEAIPVFGDD
jgi:hypothetical protein